MNVWYFFVIKKVLSSDSISLKDLLIGFVVMWLKNGSKIFGTELQWIFGSKLVGNPLFFKFFMFFVFKGLWWKFFRALEAWIRRASLICSLLRFLVAFEFDSNDLWDLRIWFGWFLFECSLYLKVCDGSSSGL